jgi:hypothetical protein
MNKESRIESIDD